MTQADLKSCSERFDLSSFDFSGRSFDLINEHAGGRVQGRTKRDMLNLSTLAHGEAAAYQTMDKFTAFIRSRSREVLYNMFIGQWPS